MGLPPFLTGAEAFFSWHRPLCSKHTFAKIFDLLHLKSSFFNLIGPQSTRLGVLQASVTGCWGEEAGVCFFPPDYSSTNATFVKLSPNNSVPKSQVFLIFLDVFCSQTRAPTCFSCNPKRMLWYFSRYSKPYLDLHCSCYFQIAGQLLSFLPIGDRFLFHCF